MSALVPVSDSIWVVAAPFSFFGLHIGSRMTVIRLRDGSLLNETVLFHRDSGSLIAADLIENFPSCDHAPTRWYLKINGALGQPTWPRAMRALYWRRDLARASIERILAWPVERVILAHGEIIEGNARDALRQGLAWLR